MTDRWVQPRRLGDGRLVATDRQCHTGMSGPYYLINMGDGDIVKCPGGHAIAEKHLQHIRNWYITTYRAAHDGSNPETVPWLIGVYPPETVGGPEGKGGVFSYGYTPTLTGSINTPPQEWQRLTQSPTP